MTKNWVINSSPIIALCKIRRINLLTDLADNIIIVSGVYREITRTSNPSDEAKIWINKEGKKYIKQDVNIDLKIAAWDLGLGESEVLTYCLRDSNSLAVIDDMAARKCAYAFNVEMKGTLSILLLAKEKKIITHVKPILNDLVNSGFRINKSIKETMLNLANEK